jgi:hypothetical protein
MAIIEEFLSSILAFLRVKDAAQLQLWLRVEPPLPDQFFQLSQELRQSYNDSKALEKYIEKLLPENNNGKADEGDTWPGFLAFIKEYLEFWRDVNFEDLLETHTQLSGVIKYTPSANILEEVLIGYCAVPVLLPCRMRQWASSSYPPLFNCV